MTQRYVEIDYIKVIGIIAVILIHSLRPIWNPLASPTERFLNSELRFAVPGFLFCSGFLYAKTRAYDWRLTLSRLRRIAIPYLIASVGAEIYQANHLQPRTAEEIVGNLLTGNAFAHYYYVFVIVVLVVATPVFARFSTRAIATFTVLAIAAHAYFIVAEVQPGLPTMDFLPVFWQFRFPALWWSFFLLGWVARQHADGLRGWAVRQRRSVAWLLSLLCIGFAAAQLLAVPHLVTKLTAWLQIYAIVALIGVLSCGASKTPTIVRHISDSTYGVYLFHLFFLLPIRQYFPQTIGEFDPKAFAARAVAGILGSILLVTASRMIFRKHSRLIMGA